MSKEMIINAILEELDQGMRGLDLAEIDALCDAILEAKRIYVTAAGRSLLLLKTLAMSLKQIGLEAYVVGDVTTPGIREGDLLIACSYSGSTKSTRLFTETAKEKGAKLCLITAKPSSPIRDTADFTVTIPVYPEKEDSPIFHGYSFNHATLTLVYVIMYEICDRLGATEQTLLSNHANLE
ncbi:MAG: SIS domain-containing protein [Christensenellaceae bacterium]|nr:SIS domain-containing protein [Christensenellaceae bacterium]